MPRLIHVTIIVRDYDEAIDFYVGRLGFALTEDSLLPAGKRWVIVTPGDGGGSLLLARAADDRQRAAIGQQGAGRVFLFLGTNDFVRDHAVLVEKGIHFVEPPRHEAYGTVAVFEDLYGNRWDLIEAA